jgi:uncharacterized protein
LKELADHVIEHELYWDYSVRFFDPKLGFPLSNHEKGRNWCGAGKMIAVDCDGNLYPCIRFLNFCLGDKKPKIIGDIDNGINYDLVRPFLTLTMENQSPKECVDCKVASGCSWCTGANYLLSPSGTIFQRSTANCKMHKANVRVCHYFWDELKRKKNITRPNSELVHLSLVNTNKKFLLVITKNSIRPHCCYQSSLTNDQEMSEDLFEKAIDFGKKNGYQPIIMHDRWLDFEPIRQSSLPSDTNIAICTLDEVQRQSKNRSNIISIQFNKNEIDRLSETIKSLKTSVCRINLNVEDLPLWKEDDLNRYDVQLGKIADYFIAMRMDRRLFEINALTDPLELNKPCDCDAGLNSITIAPDGNFYICPAFYFDPMHGYSVGNISEGITGIGATLLQSGRSHICDGCKAYHCKRCKYLNVRMTGEISCPSKIQCVISHIELRNAKKYQEKLLQFTDERFSTIIDEVVSLDPMDNLLMLQNKL